MVCLRYLRSGCLTLTVTLISHLAWLSMGNTAQHSFTHYSKKPVMPSGSRPCPFIGSNGEQPSPPSTDGEQHSPPSPDGPSGPSIHVFVNAARSVTECMLMCRGYSNGCGGAVYSAVAGICAGFEPASNNLFCFSDPTGITSLYVNAKRYLGCYTDDNVLRAMGDLVASNNISMDNNMCCSVCKTHDPNHLYFGTQGYYHCYCSNSSTYSTYGLAEMETKCGLTCAGNTQQQCGGLPGQFISVYLIDGVC